MAHCIEEVARSSPAWRAGLRPGDMLETLQGEPVIDEIDYQALICADTVLLEATRKGGKRKLFRIRKEEGEPLGLRFGQSMTLSPRSCRNHCVFCFIDQMPPGLRETLYVKDDDWRYSLMMGNFVTLTNVDEPEFERILRRKPSPLYVRVPAPAPALRCRIKNNRFAGDILQRLRRLADAGIRFHCQIVLCPGYNDGDALEKTLRDLMALAPAACTAALVPVGLTKYREGLEPLTPFTRETAAEVLRRVAPLQEKARRTLGTTFAFPSDEFFCLAGQPIPPLEWYEDFPQIENGVGLLRKLETELEEAARLDDAPPPPPKRLLIATGVSAAPHLRRLCERFAPEGTRVTVQPIVNRFFGETVTVAGLLTGGDLLSQLSQELLLQHDALLLSGSMIRHEGDLFLDDMQLSDFRARMPIPVHLIGGLGEDLYRALRGEYDE